MKVYLPLEKPFGFILNCALNLILFLSFSSLAHADEKASIKALYSSGATAVDLATFHSTLSVEAVILASKLRGDGTMATSGTLTQTSPSLESFNYSSSPQNRLKINFFNGQKVDYIIKDLKGDISSGSNNFLSSNYTLKIRVIHQGSSDFELTALQLNGNRQGTMLGTWTHEGIQYQFAINLLGTYFFESDSTGTHFKTQYQVAGTATTADTKIDISEGWHHELVSSGSVAVSNVIKNVQSSMILANGTRYQFHDALIKKAFRDGRPSEPDYWQAQGTLSKNGQTIGRLQLGYTPQKAVFWLVLPGANGGEDKIELESWILWGTGSVLDLN